MASSLPLTTTFTALPSTNTQSVSQRVFKTRTNKTHGFRVSCNGEDHNTQKLTMHNVDRRNLLVGLGGLYTAANLTNSLPAALAEPIISPDITQVCEDANSGFRNLEEAVRSRKCCPPSLGKTIKPFVFPTEKTVRMRWPAHKGTKEQVDNYKKAIQAMRNLPEDHPHSFNTQAKIHCAYCNGAYTQVANGYPDIEIQIHNNWLFFPFHRWYIYFYERILGKLIDDPTFALPYWNWDDPAGMMIPEIVVPAIDNCIPNPLFEVYRDVRHLPPAIVDLNYDGSERGTTDEIQKACNLSTVYRDLVRNGGDTLSFFGGEYVAGPIPLCNDSMSIGSVEASSHGAVHRWVGDPTQPNNEDMGNFYSAGYDPVFYIHHANVDRMWKLWKDLDIPGHVEPSHPDWLNASYVFYDENEDLVRVCNKDSVNLDKLKYNYYEQYKDHVFPWRRSRPAKRSKSLQVTTIGEYVETVDEVNFPVKLDKIIKVRVKRPAVNRTEAQKAKANEILVINNIQYSSHKFVKFDVFVNDMLKDGVVTTPCDPEYAGGFSQLPHLNKMAVRTMTTAERFGLTELLEDTNTEGEEYATVTLVPRKGYEDLTIGEITIKLVPF